MRRSTIALALFLTAHVACGQKRRRASRGEQQQQQKPKPKASSAPKDYYKLLGVKRGADDKELSGTSRFSNVSGQ